MPAASRCSPLVPEPYIIVNNGRRPRPPGDFIRFFADWKARIDWIKARSTPTCLTHPFEFHQHISEGRRSRHMKAKARLLAAI